MISRCPSCAGEVDDDAPRCPACHWDFAARRRILPGQSSASVEPASPGSGEPRPRQAPPLELQHFADVMEDAPAARRPDSEAVRRFNEAAPLIPQPSPKPEPAPAREEAKPVHKAKPRAQTAPAPKPKLSPAQVRARARALWIAAALVATAGLGGAVWRLVPAGDGERSLPLPKTAISFPADDDAVRVDAAQLLAAPSSPAALPPPLPAAPKTAQAPVEKPMAKTVSATPVAPKTQRWVFQGKAFDVLTLHPVYLADLTFFDQDGKEAAKARTDETGSFSVEVPPSAGGYRLAVSQPDYLDRYLDDLTPSIRLADKKLRRQLAKALPKNEQWRGRPGAPLRRDIVLIPAAPAQ